MNEEEGLFASASEGDLITVAGETGDEAVRHSAIVFDDEYAARNGRSRVQRVLPS
jgi:hypothetical protein